VRGASEAGGRGPGAPAETVAGPAGRVAGATLVSRALGLAREGVFAALFGKGGLSDAFVFAFRIPNLLRDFFAEGALSSAFVPALARTRAREGEEAARRLARRVLGTLAVVTGGVAALGVLFAPEVVGVVAPDAPGSWRPLTVLLTRVMFPFLVLVALAAAAMGALQVHGKYFLPAIAPAVFNLVAVAGGGVLLALALEPRDAILGWALLVLAGGLAQLLVQVPGLRALGVKGPPLFDLRFRDPALRGIARRMGPVLLGLAGTNLMLVVTTAIASRGEGWASALQYAFRLVHLPIGLVGVALGTVVLSAGARREAAGDAAGLDDLVRRGLRLNAFLGLPAAAGLWALAEPLVAAIYQRGAFGSEATSTTATALGAYAVGVVFYAGVKAAAPAHLARGDTRTPMLCSLAGIGAHVAVALLLVDAHGVSALALAVSVGTAVNYGLLRWASRRRHGPGSAPGWGAPAASLAGAVAMGALARGLVALGLTGEAVAGAGALGLPLMLGVSVGLGGLYLAVTAALGLEESRACWRALGGRRAG
jgi:putative peptidoglycan lipid II flippase